MACHLLETGGSQPHQPIFRARTRLLPIDGTSYVLARIVMRRGVLRTPILYLGRSLFQRLVSSGTEVDSLRTAQVGLVAFVLGRTRSLSGNKCNGE